LAGSHRALGRSTCRRRPDQRQLDRCLRAPVRIDGSDRELFQALSSRRCGSGQAAKYGWRTVLSIKRSARPSHCPASSARPGSATSEWLMAESQTPFQSRYVGLMGADVISPPASPGIPNITRRLLGNRSGFTSGCRPENKRRATQAVPVEQEVGYVEKGRVITSMQITPVVVSFPRQFVERCATFTPAALAWV
jgi:hypothetical protein